MKHGKKYNAAMKEFDRATYQLDTQELSVEALSHD